MSKVSFSANRGGFEIGTPPGGQNFEGLGRVTLGVELVQNSIVTTGVLMSEPDKKISAICLAVCSKNANMSIFAFHKYYNIDYRYNHYYWQFVVHHYCKWHHPKMSFTKSDHLTVQDVCCFEGFIFLEFQWPPSLVYRSLETKLLQLSNTTSV